MHREACLSDDPVRDRIGMALVGVARLTHATL